MTLLTHIEGSEQETEIELRDIFYCTIEPLNFSDFAMNLIYLNMSQFCWSLNLLLPQRSGPAISLSD